MIASNRELPRNWLHSLAEGSKGWVNICTATKAEPWSFLFGVQNYFVKWAGVSTYSAISNTLLGALVL